jgi:hypothetical protein
MKEHSRPLEELVKELPPELRQEVKDFVEFLLERRRYTPKAKFKLDWRGALKGLREHYSSVELQHKALDWWR